MKLQKLVVPSAVALGCAGASVAAPLLAPYLASVSIPFFGAVLAGIFREEDFDEQLGKVIVDGAASILSNLSSSAIEQIPSALAREHNFHLETLLATAYLRSLSDVGHELEAGGGERRDGRVLRIAPPPGTGADEGLRDQALPIVALLASRIERGLEAKEPFTLFPLEAKRLGDGRSPAGRLSAEEFALLAGDEKVWRGRLADEVESALRRWLGEERAARHAPLALRADAPLPEPTRAYLREQLPPRIAHAIGELVKSEDMSKSWIAFQRAHLQGIASVVREIDTSAGAANASLRALAGRVDGLAGRDEIAATLAQQLEVYFGDLNLPLEHLSDLLERQGEDLRRLDERLGAKIDESTERLSREFGAARDRVISDVNASTGREVSKAVAEARSQGERVYDGIEGLRGDIGRLHDEVKRLDRAPRPAPNPLDLASKEHDPSWVRLETLVDAGTSVADVGLELLKACNRAARALYRAKVLGEAAGGAESAVAFQIWGGIWQEADFEAQRNFVRLTDRKQGGNVDYIVQSSLAEGVEENRPSKIWIVGPAGIGKTTVLYRCYFQLIEAQDGERREVRALPVPLLMQSRNLGATQVRLLDEEKDPEAFLRLILKLWLYNRHVFVPPERMGAVLGSLARHLSLRNVVILIDGFDELNRMSFQTSVFRSFFGREWHFVCASRPETDISESTHRVITLDGAWDYSTIKSYLSKRLPDDRAADIKQFLRHLSANRLDWLRTPRNLNSILLLERSAERPPDSARWLVRVVKRGEYRLHEELYRSSRSRLLLLAERTYPELVEPGLDDEIRRRFEEIAEWQLSFGRFELARDQGEWDGVWDLVKEARDLLDVVGDGRRYALRLLNFNLVDFFLTRKIANEIRSSASLAGRGQVFDHLWSANQLAYLSEELRKDGALPEALVGKIRGMLGAFQLPRLERGQGYRELPSPGAVGFGAANLVQLAIKLEEDLRGGRRNVEVVGVGEQLANLHLAGADLGGVTFESCRFDGSVLAGANLAKAVFRDCSFRQVDLRDADATFADFAGCEFDFDEEEYRSWYESRPSAVHGAVIQDAKFRHCDGYGFDVFERRGAKGRKSRYRGLFAERFFKDQRVLLGGSFEEAEAHYVSAVEEFLESLSAGAAARGLPPDRPAYLVDLMAGGSNERLLRLMTGVDGKGRRTGKHFEHLRVLAIDKDTSHLVEVRKTIGERFAAVTREIAGRANLAEALSSNFDDHPVRADVIIGKKALHELPAEAQQALLAECSETLEDGGRLILFADSPSRMSPEGYERLRRLQVPLREGDADVSALRSMLVEDLRLGDASGDCADDCAIFSNLWVLVKDWANGNDSELKSRYFSSVEEIARWGEEAGLTPVGDPLAARYSYRLQPYLFNERGINQVGNYLERHLTSADARIRDEDVDAIVEYLEGDERYQLFREFAETHLWDHKADRPTALGEKLGAQREAVSFGKLHGALSDHRIALRCSSGVGFDFSVHIVVFEKPTSAGNSPQL